jgi:hypothetical protein
MRPRANPSADGDAETDAMSDNVDMSLHGLHLLIGPSGDGLWIVQDAAGVCGAVFMSREDALHYAKSECEAAQPRPCEWRLVASLELRSIFARSAQAA